MMARVVREIRGPGDSGPAAAARRVTNLLKQLAVSSHPQRGSLRGNILEVRRKANI